MESIIELGKRPRGRPATEDVKNNKDTYFTAYYHKTNHDIICECGQYVKSKGMYMHKKSKKHSYLINKKNFQGQSLDFRENI